MAYGEFADHNWGAEVYDHADELAIEPHHSRNVPVRNTDEEFDATLEDRQAARAAFEHAEAKQQSEGSLYAGLGLVDRARTRRSQSRELSTLAIYGPKGRRYPRRHGDF